MPTSTQPPTAARNTQTSTPPPYPTPAPIIDPRQLKKRHHTGSEACGYRTDAQSAADASRAEDTGGEGVRYLADRPALDAGHRIWMCTPRCERTGCDAQPAARSLQATKASASVRVVRAWGLCCGTSKDFDGGAKEETVLSGGY
ncbi:hypothetical protein MCOR27_007753 [Pyricularia oryzae]|nr:hypothetical protein MCOR26_008444 [Pyricularia oryzae]KAI6273695.1 hypothetical protein MCOR27_007753 [Pyricularia oryzae]KAI6320621.1 hypothetical protein MCOR30_008181 [Pyricularia oryzae]KAI6321660.1 hypothetical protein MCOR29_004969 [Pyricularia oryzae]KAI6366942.1 hypothetical protein MCOR31_006271 [Pyricularia oryzae]